MKIQLKRNTAAGTSLPTLSAGEPVWCDDKLYIGATGAMTVAAGTPVLVGPSNIQINSITASGSSINLNSLGVSSDHFCDYVYAPINANTTVSVNAASKFQTYINLTNTGSADRTITFTMSSSIANNYQIFEGGGVSNISNRSFTFNLPANKSVEFSFMIHTNGNTKTMVWAFTNELTRQTIS